MKDIITLFTLLLLSFQMGVSQSKQLFYYNEEGRETSKDNSFYYKIINYDSKGKVHGAIKDYYSSGKGMAMADGALEINKSDDTKSVYWGKRIFYYKNGVMQKKKLYTLDGKMLYTKTWYKNGNIKSYISRYSDTDLLFTIDYNEDGTVSESKIYYEDGTKYPKVFKFRDDAYYSVYNETFQNNDYEKFWNEDENQNKGTFITQRGYKVQISGREPFTHIFRLGSDYTTFNITINFTDYSGDKNGSYGIIYNHVNENKYSIFYINPNGYFSIIHYNKGEIFTEADNVASSTINPKNNKLEIFKNNDDIEFTINEKVVYKTKIEEDNRLSTFGIYSDSKTKSFLIDKFSLIGTDEITRDLREVASTENAVSSGTGFIVDNRGYILTNNHVIRNASYIELEFKWNGKIKTYPAKVLETDEENDIALLRVVTDDFTKFGNASFSVLSGEVPVGTDIFALGYPRSNEMGKEIKYINGVISAKSGNKGRKSHYQTTLTADHGNSGGPVFDKNGNVIGIVVEGFNKGNRLSDVVTYIIKSSMISKFVKDYNSKLTISRPNNLSKESRPNMISRLSNDVCLIRIW